MRLETKEAGVGNSEALSKPSLDDKGKGKEKEAVEDKMLHEEQEQQNV